LIAAKPWEKQEQVTVYRRLSWDLEYQGAIVLALDPWMVFRKHTNPGLTVERAYTEAGGGGLLLIPGRDKASVRAWTARLIQSQPGVFPSGENVWREWETRLFSANRFPNGSQTYTWNDVFFRLMGNETAWVYAPLSAIRRYNNPRKAILEATAFPEAGNDTQYSLQASLLWAVPIGADEEQEKLAETIKWLKKPETQTVIADILGWIPADPYGAPFDPMSLNSHRNWLTAAYVYEVNE
jgi:ABC-type glycerol-3-phosphate transport system substrate-binding protein